MELFNEYRDSHPMLSKRRRFAEGARVSLLPTITFLIFDDMHMLGSPPGEEENIERLIGPLQEAVELGEKRRPLLYSADEIVAHFAEYNERARRYGLDECVVTTPHLRNIEV